jgi:hypothetical protein
LDEGEMDIEQYMNEINQMASSAIAKEETKEKKSRSSPSILITPEEEEFNIDKYILDINQIYSQI